MVQADGQEVLVVDGDEKVQRGLHQVLTDLGLVPTVFADPERAQRLLKEKFFGVALVDLDTPRLNGGLELVRWIKLHSPTTTSMVMASRKIFDSAVDAFRAGAADVILKAPEQVDYLKLRVVEVVGRMSSRVEDDRLLDEALEVHEGFLKRLMDTSRRAAELEERLGGGAQSADADECAVLVVEPNEDAWLGKELEAVLRDRSGYLLRTAASGGEGLDVASTMGFQIALVRDALPDLPGTMVVSALKGQSPDTITILFSRPGPDLPGKAEVLEGSRAIALVPEFSEVRQIVERLDELREAFGRKGRERRYLGAFRQQNYELLRRYALLKQKLQDRIKPE